MRTSRPLRASRSSPSRVRAAIAIALREWRGFGAPVNDAPPDPQRSIPADAKPERADGLWQRVGEYWWLGQDGGRKESAWTGKHDARNSFPAERDGDYAWSAAFIFLRHAQRGCGRRLSLLAGALLVHQCGTRGSPQLRIRAGAPEAYAPRAGDLICMGRACRRICTTTILPSEFAGHCDLVVDVAPAVLTVVGGNVDDAVTAKHVPVTDDGTLAAPTGACSTSAFMVRRDRGALRRVAHERRSLRSGAAPSQMRGVATARAPGARTTAARRVRNPRRPLTDTRRRRPHHP